MKKTVLIIGMGVVCSLTAPAAIIYVATNSPSDGPGTAWSNACHTLQAAADSAVAGDCILVTNGLYNMGGQKTGSVSNRCVITNALTLASVNGPDKTIIQGEMPDGSGTARGMWLAEGCTISGFTITNGQAIEGGGIWSEGSLLLTNCILVDCQARDAGGGLYSDSNAVLVNCQFSSCGVTNHNAKGGGAYIDGYATVSNCTLTGNWATGYNADGGGLWAEQAYIIQSTVTLNRAFSGAGIFINDSGTVLQCHLTDNTSTNLLGKGGAVCFGSCQVLV